MIGTLYLSILLRVIVYIPLSYALTFNLVFYVFLSYKSMIWFFLLKVYHTFIKYTFKINLCVFLFILRNGSTGFFFIDLLTNKLIRRERKRTRRYFARLESNIFRYLVTLSPTLCYYFILYHTFLPALSIFSIRTFTFVLNNQDLILDFLNDFKILEKFLDEYIAIVGPGGRNILNEITDKREPNTSTGPPSPDPNPGGSGGGSEYVVAESSRDAIRRAEYNNRNIDIDNPTDTVRSGTRENNLYIAELAAALELEESNENINNVNISNENMSNNVTTLSQEGTAKNNKGKGILKSALRSSNVDNSENSSLNNINKRVRIVTDDSYSEDADENRPKKRPRRNKPRSIVVISPITSPVTSPVTSPIGSSITSSIVITSPITSSIVITSPSTSPMISPITSPIGSPMISPVTGEAEIRADAMDNYVFIDGKLKGIKDVKDSYVPDGDYILGESVPDFSKTGLNSIIIDNDYLNGGKSLENNISNNKYLSTHGLNIKGEVRITSNNDILSSVKDVDLGNYVKTVDHLNRCRADIENSKNKLSVRDINRVFNNYYRPGIVPSDVFEALWLENAYAFLFKSKITVNSLLDGRFEYAIDIKYTDEERKIMDDHKATLKRLYPDKPRNYFEDEVNSSGEFIFKLDALDFKSKVMENGEWFSGIDKVDRPSYSSALKNFNANQIRKLLFSGQNICVLDKHNIINNPTWEYGLQDRRWFGPAHTVIDEHLKSKFLKLKSQNLIQDNEPFKNKLTEYDEKYRKVYNLPEASQKSLEELNFKYEIDEDINKNSEMYNNLKDSNLSNYIRERLDVESRISWLSPIKSMFYNNPFHSALRTNHSSAVPQDPQEFYTSASAMSGYRGVKLLSESKSSHIDLSGDQDSSIELPFIKYVPWEFKIPENADGFTDDCFIWENEYCKKLVPKYRLRLLNIPEPDMTRFFGVNINSKDRNFPSGKYIFSKDTLGKVFSEYNHAMKLTYEICEKIDNNNMLLYYNLFSNNCSNLCLSCADKVVIYNRELCETLDKYSDFFEKENSRSKMKSTMYNYYGFYANRAWSLETSYDKLMSRLYRDINPENAWSRVELKKEEIKDAAYTEYKFIMDVIKRDFNYAKDHNLRFDIRKSILGEVESRKWDLNKEYNIKVMRGNYEIEKRISSVLDTQPRSFFRGFCNYAEHKDNEK